MDVCMVPEHLARVQRSPLEAELEDVRETKRLRLLDSQPQRMTLRSAEERHSPKRYDNFHVYASFCKREPAEGAGLASEKQKNWHIRDVKIPKHYGEAVRSPQREEWLAGMRREVEAMFK
ncbi:hypothetical protein V7S43_014098 [Phytophthora oleae]|uniref:Uncharacterized protein n=1 Tax=Phytophthora oleae TaxID=2107226 RepID=A0ABD3F3U4_9STRA